jgi:hypothetical protein
MTIKQIYTTDCDAHSACHTLARAVEAAFPESNLECTHHDTSGILCVHEGSIIVDGVRYGLFIRSIASRELTIEVDAVGAGHEAIIEEVAAAYQALPDAGGFTHTLNRKIETYPNRTE